MKNKEPMFTLKECQAEYLTGVRHGKEMITRGLRDKTVEIMMTVIDGEEIESVKKVIHFSNIVSIRSEADDAVVRLIYQGKILKKYL